MKIAVLLFNDFETLDAFGPVELFGRLTDLYAIGFYSLHGGLVKNKHGVAIATEALDRLPQDLEIFIIPGFGVAGVLGIGLTLTSLILIMLNNDFFNFEFVPLGDIIVASFATIGGLTGGALLLFFGGAKLTQTKAFKRIALTDIQEVSQGYTTNFNAKEMLGKKGIAYTVLRPSGRVKIDEEIYDAFTRGDYIERGDAIEVVDTEGNTLKVRRTNP